MFLIYTRYVNETGKQKIAWWGRYNKCLICDPWERPNNKWFEDYSYGSMEHVLKKANKLPTKIMMNDLQNYNLTFKQIYNIYTEKFKFIEEVATCKNKQHHF